MRIDINGITYDVDGGVLYGGEPYTGEVVETTKDGAVIAEATYFRVTRTIRSDSGTRTGQSV